MSVEDHIRQSGQHPGHACPVCGSPLDKEVLITEELVVVDGVAIHVPPYLMKTLHKLYDNWARPVNKAVLNVSPDLLRVHLHNLRKLLFHTRLTIRDIDRENIELRLSQHR